MVSKAIKLGYLQLLYTSIFIMSLCANSVSADADSFTPVMASTPKNTATVQSRLAASSAAPKQVRQSIAMQFDFLLDEKIIADDPRIKSIVYSSIPNNYVVIKYANPNASKLANRLAEIMTAEHAKVLKPIQSDHGNLKDVLVYVVSDE